MFLLEEAPNSAHLGGHHQGALSLGHRSSVARIAEMDLQRAAV
jgi:hypothetical protein